jgi:hypothetical protein
LSQDIMGQRERRAHNVTKWWEVFGVRS